MKQDEVLALVIAKITDYMSTVDATIPIDATTKLVGRESVIDSMGLVNIIIDIESEFLDRGFEVSLTSENAMSQSRSPFRSAETLAEYIHQQICPEESV